MTRRKTLLAAAVCGLLLAAFTWFFSRTDEEPVADGHSLGYWVHKAAHPDHWPAGAEFIVDSNAVTALGKIGTNAIPHLLSWMECSAVARRSSLARAESIPEAFYALGSNALPAVPALFARASSWDGTYGNLLAIHSLFRINPLPMPEVLQLLTNSDPDIRTMAVAEAGATGRRGLPFIPVLLASLYDPNSNVAREAAISLQMLQLAPEIVLPELAAAACSKNAQLRDNAKETLCSYAQTNLSLYHLLYFTNSASLTPQEILNTIIRPQGPAPLTNSPPAALPPCAP